MEVIQDYFCAPDVQDEDEQEGEPEYTLDQVNDQTGKELNIIASAISIKENYSNHNNTSLLNTNQTMLLNLTTVAMTTNRMMRVNCQTLKSVYKRHSRLSTMMLISYHH